MQKSNAGAVEEAREDQKKAINRAIGGLICVWGLKYDKSFYARLSSRTQNYRGGLPSRGAACNLFTSFR